MMESMIYSLGAITVCFITIKSAYWMIQLIRQGNFFKYEKKIKEAQAIRANADPAYSEAMLDLIHNLVNRIAVIEFNKAVDGQDISKMHMSKFKPIIEKIAKRVRASVQKHIESCGILDETFIENYIIDVTTMAVKSLTKKQVNVILEEDESDF